MLKYTSTLVRFREMAAEKRESSRQTFFFSIRLVFIVEGIAQNIKHKLIMIINEVQLFLRERLRKDHGVQIKRTGAVAESAASLLECAFKIQSARN